MGPKKPAPGVYEVLSEQDLLAGGIGLLEHSRATGAMQRDSSGTLVRGPEILVPRSNTFSSWNKIRTDTTEQSDGGWLLESTSTNASFGSSIRYQGLQDLTGRWGVRVRFKAGSDSAFMILWAMDTTETDEAQAWFDVVNGVAGSTANSGNLSVVSSQVVSGPDGGGYYVAEIIFQSTGALGSATSELFVSICDADGSRGTTIGRDAIIKSVRFNHDPNADDDIAGVETDASLYYGPRIDYDADGNLLGLLREVASQNDVPYSNDYNQWSGSAAAGALQNATGADGIANTAWTIEDDDAGSAESVRENLIVPDDAVRRTWSVLVGYADNEAYFPAIRIVYFGGTSGSDAILSINQKTGAGALVAGAAGDTTWRIERFNDDFWRAEMTVANANDGSLNLQGWLYPAFGTTIGVASTAATGTVVAHHAQMEDLPYASSIIPTSGSAVARAEDFVTSDLSWLPQPVGGVFELVGSSVAVGNDVGSKRLLAFHDGSTANRLLFDTPGSARPKIFVSAGGGIVAELTTDTAVAANTEFTMRLQVYPDDVALKVDDDPIEPDTDTGGLVPIGLDDLEIGEDRGGGQSASMHLKSLTYAHGARIA